MLSRLVIKWCGMQGTILRPYACKAYALPAELIVHNYVDITSRLAFRYPQRLDTIITGLNSVKLVCVATPSTSFGLNLAKAVLFWLVHLCVYPSPAHITTERGSKTHVWEWFQKL